VLSKSIVSVQKQFRWKYGDDRQRGAAPSRKIIGQWVHQWCETGSVQVKARTRRNTIRSPENIQRVIIISLHGPTFHCSLNVRPHGTQSPLSATPPTTHTSSTANSKWVTLNATPCTFGTVCFHRYVGNDVSDERNTSVFRTKGAACCCETERCYISEENLHSQCHENLKFDMKLLS
jgi:hypothetical protein